MSKPNNWLILFFLCIAEIASAQFGPQQQLHSCVCSVSKMLSADLDGDRFPDLLVLNWYTGNLMWFKNDGKGGISRQFFVAPSQRQRFKESFFTADLDGDKDSDVLAMLNDNQLVWFQNDGKDQFGELQLITKSGNDYEIGEVIDLDMDQDQDIIIFSNSESAIIWLRNDGRGQFAIPIVVSRESPNVTDIEVADVDADQDLDIVSANLGGISWYINQGKENFTSKTPFGIASAYPVNQVFVHDYDQDKDLDVLGFDLNNGDRNVVLHFFERFGPQLSEYRSRELLLAPTRFFYPVDMDKNGEIEYITTVKKNAGLRIQRYDGSILYSKIITLLDETNYINKITTADWDQDGDLDIVFHRWGEKMEWLENRGGDVFVPKILYESQLNGLANLQIFDLDGDGDKDILTASDKDDRIAWFPNEGAGKFGALKTITTTADSATFVFAVDLDRDQKLDVISSSWKDNKIAWYKNLGSAVFSAQQIISDSARNASAVYAADLDQDGAMDILVASSSKLAWFKYKSDGSFQEFLIFRDVLNLPIINYRQMYPSILPADFDNDGDLDVIASSYTKKSIQWFRNDGKGNFSQAPISLDTRSIEFVWGLAVADLDGDKDIDVLSASLDGQVVWFRNDSLGKYFQPSVITTKARGASYVKAGDVDGDGDLDIVSAATSDKLAWYENKGQGQFTDEKIISLKQHWLLNGLDLADLDADGDLDLASCSQFDDKVAWFENRFNHATISGYTFWDENGNKRFDAGEKPLPNYPINLNPSAEAAFSGNDGRFRFFTGTGRYQLKANLDSCWQLTTDSTTYTVNVGGQVANNLNFGFRINNAAQRVSVRLNSGPTRCGFEVPFWLSVYNAACAPSKGKFGVVLSKLATFRSASQFPQSMSGDTMWWNYSDLVGSSTQQIQLVLQVAGTNFIGDTIKLKGVAYLENARGKLELASTFEFKSEIRCAYDPNDKQTFPNRTDEYPQNYTLFKENLEYLIRFQNVGNDTAFTVTIRDTLDARLDWKTFQPLQGSHLYSSNIAANGVVTFTFSKILLPPSSSNEPLSHGFVRYTIASKTGLPEETAIKNTAHIYFDFNPAIVTNTTSNLMVSKLPRNGTNASEGELFNVYPNPFTRYFQVESLEELAIGVQYTFYLYNGNAQLLQSQGIDEQVERIKTGTLPVGLYFYLIKDAQGRIVDSGKVVCR